MLVRCGQPLWVCRDCMVRKQPRGASSRGRKSGRHLENHKIVSTFSVLPLARTALGWITHCWRSFISFQDVFFLLFVGLCVSVNKGYFGSWTPPCHICWRKFNSSWENMRCTHPDCPHAAINQPGKGSAGCRSLGKMMKRQFLSAATGLDILWKWPLRWPASALQLWLRWRHTLSLCEHSEMLKRSWIKGWCFVAFKVDSEAAAGILSKDAVALSKVKSCVPI